MESKLIPAGSLFFLWHPGTRDIFSGYGLTTYPGRNDTLVGLLMVDRPHPVDPAWLAEVATTFGGYSLYAMTATGERGIACQMYVEAESLGYLRQFAHPFTTEVINVLTPLLHQPPQPRFHVRWNESLRLWVSAIVEDQRPQPPDLETLMEWLDEGGCEATDGCWVEPDGTCPHGHKSWLLVLGLI